MRSTKQMCPNKNKEALRNTCRSSSARESFLFVLLKLYHSPVTQGRLRRVYSAFSVERGK